MVKTTVHQVRKIPGNGAVSEPVAVERKDESQLRETRPREFAKGEDFEKFRARIKELGEEVRGHIATGATVIEGALDAQASKAQLENAARKMADVMQSVFKREMPELYDEFRSDLLPNEPQQKKVFLLVEREAAVLVAKRTLKGAVPDDSLKLIKDGLADSMRKSMSHEERLYCVRAMIRARRIQEFQETPLERLGVKLGNARQAEMMQKLYLNDAWGKAHPKAAAVDIILAARHTDLGEDVALDEALNKSQGHERGFPIQKLSDTLGLTRTDAAQRKNLPQVAAMIKDAITTKLIDEKAPSKTDYRTTQRDLVKWVAERLMVVENLNDRVVREIDPEIRRHEARVTTKRIIERILRNERQSENPLQDALEGGIRKMT